MSPQQQDGNLARIDLEKQAVALMARLAAPGVTARALLGVLQAGKLSRHADGHELCVEGGPSLGLYFLLGGQVSVQRTDPDGDRRVVATIRAPAMVGHMGVVDREKRSATVVALGPITTVDLDIRGFDRLVGDPSEAGFAMRQLILGSLTRQLAAANLRLARGAEQAAREQLSAASSSPAGDAAVAAQRELDLMGVSDILEGWDITAAELDEVSVVYDQDQLRNRRRGGR